MPDAETSHPSTATTDDHGSGHGHESAAEPLGPVDVTTWAYALAGGAVGVILVLVMFVARGA